MWVFLAFLSALGLGFYDICKKRSLTSWGVFPVLTASTVISSLLLLPMYIGSRLADYSSADSGLSAWHLLYVPHVSGDELFFIFIKACIVLASWVCAYYAMRRLPITVVTPINATRPMWTLIGAVLIFGETLNGYQWSGVGVALVSFAAFSLVSMPRRKHAETETGRRKDDWLPFLFLFMAVLLGAASGLYDKHLMRHYDHNAVLVYYTWFQALLMLGYGCLSGAYRQMAEVTKRDTSESRPYVALFGISLFLLCADFVYLLALSDPNSLIAVVSLIRRSSVLITFAYGAMVLREKKIFAKSVCLCGIILAMLLLLLGSL